MTLNYRGSKYDTADLARAQSHASPRKGTYRGVSLDLGAAQDSAASAGHPTLKYRGLPYRA